MSEGVRLDKWLWAARFFKTRALAQRACELGRVQVVHTNDELLAKASRDVHVGERLRVRNETGEFVVEVLSLSSVRGSAAIAQGMYAETEESKAQRMRLLQERRMMQAFDAVPAVRPTKKQRREINEWRKREW